MPDTVIRMALLGTLALGAASAATLRAQLPPTAGARLEAARQREVIAGDIAGAIKDYEAIVAAYEKTDRSIAAQALLRMAGAQERLGARQARETYARVIREYADHPSVVSAAQARLAPGQGAVTPVVRAVPTDTLTAAFNLSADGQWLTGRGANGAIVVRSVGDGTERVLRGQPYSPTDDEIYSPVLSPDGKLVAYTYEHDGNDEEFSELRLLPVDPGARPRTLLRSGPDIQTVWPWAWSQNGSDVLTEVTRKDQSWQFVWVSASGRPLVTLKTLDWRRQRPRDRASLSPDGKYLAYSAIDENPAKPIATVAELERRRVFVLAADGSTETELSGFPHAAVAPVWSADGSALFVLSDGALWSVPMAAGRQQGSPVLLKAGMRDVTPVGVTSTHSYVYAEQEPSVTKLSIRSASGAATGVSPTMSDFGTSGNSPAWSPNGDRIAYISAQTATRPPALVIRTLANGSERVITPGPSEETQPSTGRVGYAQPIWYSDGKHVLVWASTRPQSAPSIFLGLYRANVDTGEVVRLAPIESATRQRPQVRGALSMDGRTLYQAASAVPHDGSFPVVAIDLESGRTRTISVFKSFISGLALSPDGGMLAVNSNSEGVSLISVDGAQRRTLRQVPDPRNAAMEMAWSADGKSLLMAVGGDTANSARLVTVEVGTGLIHQTNFGSLAVPAQFSLSPDRHSIVAMSRVGGATKLWALDNVAKR